MDRAELAVGIGLRPIHYSDFLSYSDRRDLWCEFISENYMFTGGRPLKVLEQVRAECPIALHGVALSIASQRTDREEYLLRLKALIQRIDPWIVSDHFCFTGKGSHNSFDLLPVPFTQEAIEHISNHIDQAQNFLGRRLYFENISSYFGYHMSEMDECHFIKQILRRTGCGLLLDVNNVYVTSKNFGFDPFGFIDSLDRETIGEIHLAGHRDLGDFLFDTHDAPVCDEVWNLYAYTIRRLGGIPTLIEWDESVPPFERLMEEREIALRILKDNEHAPQRVASKDHRFYNEPSQ